MKFIKLLWIPVYLIIIILTIISANSLTVNFPLNEENAVGLNFILPLYRSGTNILFNTTLNSNLTVLDSIFANKILSNDWSNISIYDLYDVSDSAKDKDFLMYNETTGNWEPYSVLSTTYYANSSAVTGGSYTDSNSIISTWYYDDAYLNFTEGGGAEPLDIYINYTNVTKFNEWIIREYYLGSSSHHIQFQLWDYDSSSWENYGQIVGQEGMTWESFPVPDYSEHIQNGIVQTRLHHIETGISSHRIYIDIAWLIDASNIGVSTNLDGYAKYNFAFNNFVGNGTFNTTGLGKFGNLEIDTSVQINGLESNTRLVSKSGTNYVYSAGYFEQEILNSIVKLAGLDYALEVYADTSAGGLGGMFFQDTNTGDEVYFAEGGTAIKVNAVSNGGSAIDITNGGDSLYALNIGSGALTIDYDGNLTTTGNIDARGTNNIIVLPTSDPLVNGALWNNNSILTISSG